MSDWLGGPFLLSEAKAGIGWAFYLYWLSTLSLLLLSMTKKRFNISSRIFFYCS